MSSGKNSRANAAASHFQLQALEARVLLSVSPLPTFSISDSGDVDHLAVASNASGATVVVWSSNGQDGTTIRAQIYDSEGNASGEQIAYDPMNWAGDLQVGISGSGRFIIGWASDRGTGSGNDPLAQIFAADGSPVGDVIALNQDGAGDQGLLELSVGEDGTAAAVWDAFLPDDGLGEGEGEGEDDELAASIHLTILNIDAQSDLILVQIDDPADNVLPLDTGSPGVDAQGNVVVVYGQATFNQNQDSTGQSIRFKRFDSAGQQLGTAQTVVSNSLSTAYLAGAGVAVTPGGNFVVVYGVEKVTAADEYNGLLLAARRYNAAGAVQGGVVNIVSAGAQTEIEEVVMTIDAAGNFVVVWEQVDAAPGNDQILLKRFLANGAADGAALTVFTSDVYFRLGGVAIGGNETILVPWIDAYEEQEFVDTGDLLARYFSTAAPKPDLSIEFGDVQVGDSLRQGQTLNVPVSVHNGGGAASSGSGQLQLIASPNDVLGDDDDIVAATLSNQSLAIAAGANKAFTFRSVPINLDAGDYMFFAVVDSSDVVDESDETNNFVDSEVPLTVAPAYVDLTGALLSVRLPEVAVPGDKGTVMVNVSNEGNDAGQGTMAINVVLRGEGVDDILIGRLPAARFNLAAGRTQRFTIPVRVGADVPPGDYQVVAVIDAGGQVAESNLTGDAEENNDADATLAGDTFDPEVVWQFGLVGERRNVKLDLTANNEGGIFSISGAGSGTVIDNGFGSLDVEVMDTTATSSVRITGAPRSTSRVQLGMVNIAAPLNIFDARSSDLTNDFTTAGNLGQLNFADADDNEIEVNIAGSLGSLTGREVSFFALNVQGAIRSVKIIRGANVEIMATALGSLGVTGVRNGVAGDFSGLVELSDDTVAKTLGSLTVAGQLSDTRIISAGSMGALTVGSISNSGIFAGALNNDTFAQDIADLDQLERAQITSFTVKSTAAEASFINSLVEAYMVGKVTLKRVQLADEAPFGIAGNTVKGLTYLNPDGTRPAAANVRDGFVDGQFELRILPAV